MLTLQHVLLRYFRMENGHNTHTHTNALTDVEIAFDRLYH